MLGSEELNYLLSAGLIMSAFMYFRQRKQIMDARSIETDLVQKAYFDPLTSLPNKENVNIILDDYIYRCQRQQKTFFTAIVQIDNTSDEILVESGKRLFDSIRREDLVGHISKGVFIVIFNEYLEQSNVSIIVERIHKAFAKSFFTNHHGKVYVNMDISINSYPEKNTVEALSSYTPVK